MAARTYLCWLILALISGAALAQTPQIKWAPDLATARQASAQFKVPLLVHFYGDACLPCRTLEKNVLSNPEVIGVMNKFFICVSINGSRDRNAMAEFEVHSYPTDVFLSPTGEKLHQGVCPQDLKEYLGTLERVAVMNRDFMVKVAANRPTTATNLAQQPGMPSVGQLPSQSVPSLPPPSLTASGNSSTPGYYTASGASAMQQQLNNGAESSKFVQSGPLLAGQQPPSIRGAVQSMETQVGSSGAIGALNAATNQISTQGANATTLPQLNRSVQNAIESYAQVPSVDANSMPVPTLTDAAPSLMAGAASLTAQANNAANGAASRANSMIAQGQSAANNIWNKSAAAVAVTTDNPHFNPAAVGEMAHNGVNSTVNSLNNAIDSAANRAQSSVQTSANQAFDHVAAGANKLGAALPQLSAPALPDGVPVLNGQSQGHNQPVTANVQPSQQPQQNSVVQTVSSSTKAVKEPTPQIDGYCPVSLRGKQWRKGTSQFSVKHRGLVFWFADQSCEEAFLKNPDFYTPVLLGYDPMALINQGRMVAGSTQFGLFEDRVGPLFFSSAESKAEFMQDFNKNMQALDSILKHAANNR